MTHENSVAQKLDNRTELRLSARLLETLRISTLSEVESDILHQSLFLSASISLAARGLCPEPLAEHPACVLIKKLAQSAFGIEKIQVDRTPFARALTEWIVDIETEPADTEGLINRIQEVASDSVAREHLVSPLLSGWIYQEVINQKTDFAALRAAKRPSDLGRLTQWFTPSWIAEFLIDEVLPSRLSIGKSHHSSNPQKPRFLDSACGAGHILIPALRRLLTDETRRTDTALDPRRLEEILESSLFGLDIDALPINLSGFAIYLTSRDADRHTSLPIPNIFRIEEIASEKRPTPSGSLLLGTTNPGGRLVRVDGKTFGLEVLPSRFEAQATNPPYLSHRSMPKELSTFLRKHYSGCHFDIYAAFLELSARLMDEGGRVSMISQQSFLTISRYENLRRELFERCSLDSLVVLGAGTFAARAGEKVSNVIVSFSHKEEAGYATIYDLRRKVSKIAAEQEGIANSGSKKISHATLMKVSEDIPGFPLSPSCPTKISSIFSQFPSFENESTGITLTNGLFTCNNDKFVKHFSEIDEESMAKFVPYDKGGGKKWFARSPLLIDWSDRGDAIRDYRKKRGQSRALPGERYYFKEGITYSYIGTSGFKARLLTPGCIFDIASSALFSSKVELHYILGLLNSALMKFILGILNPTVNFQIGDLRRLPFAPPTKTIEAEVSALSSEAIALAKIADTMDSRSPSYKGPLLQAEMKKGRSSREAYSALKQKTLEINEQERRIQNSIDQLIFDLYEIDEKTREHIRQDFWVGAEDTLIQLPSLENLQKELALGVGQKSHII